jgi:hypothetical protein
MGRTAGSKVVQMTRDRTQDCSWAREAMGLQLDGELAVADASRLEGHLQGCESCRAELSALEAWVGELQSNQPVRPSDVAGPPTSLWAAIESRLDADSQSPPVERRLPQKPLAGGSAHAGAWRHRLLHRPLAAAASLAFLIGAGAFVASWLSTPSAQIARAQMVDYSILLDRVDNDVDGAVERFLKHYDAKPVATSATHAAVPGLSFNLPAELPGRYRLEGCYSLDFGDMHGVAARYRRGAEPLFVFFHPPVNKQFLGTHHESHCAVAGGAGHCVEVGAWRLIHFTDPTTCHCLLSNLHDGPEMDAVLAALAPQFGDFRESPASMPAEHSH